MIYVYQDGLMLKCKSEGNELSAALTKDNSESKKLNYTRKNEVKKKNSVEEKSVCFYPSNSSSKE